MTEKIDQVRAISKAAKAQTSEINRSAMEKIIALHPQIVLVPITRVDQGVHTDGLNGNVEVADYDFSCCVCQRELQGIGQVVVKDGKPTMIQVGAAIAGTKRGEFDVCCVCAENIDPVIADRLNYAMYLLEGNDVTSPEEAIKIAMVGD